MRRVLFLVVVLATVQHWEKITMLFQPAPEAGTAGQADVIMYGAQWCGYCAKARALFREKRIAYFEYDIERSAEGRRQYEALRGSGVPLIVVRDQVIRGYNPRLILAALDQR
ncbi:MAG: glutaredoxin family protein [Gammaproteobacteria bacterium]|nr:glutaredoxin family protein [Gammaproteobacteria bacterium]